MKQGHGVWRHEECALVLIDYQKEMFDQLRSETPAELVELNTRLLIKAAKAFDMPVILSTVGLKMGVNGPTRSSLLEDQPTTPSASAWLAARTTG